MTENTTEQPIVIEAESEEVKEIEIEFQVETNKSYGEPVFPEMDEQEQEVTLEASTETEDADDEIESDSDLEKMECDSETDSDSDSDEDLDSELDSDDEETATDDSQALIAGEAEHGDAFPILEELTLAGKIESIIFASPKPMRAVEVHELLMDQGYTLKEIQDACDELTDFYRDRAGGFHLKYIKRMGYQFQTTPAAKPLMERQFSSRPRPLSRAALETLAVIAYRSQKNKGVTRAEVEFIRGVDAGSIFKTLVERNLLECTGRKEIPGRPMMFGVTNEFLKIFQLGSISDLPTLESFQTPQDILDAANKEIEEFEAEQEGVDTEEFIADEEYSTQTQGAEEFNPLAAAAPIYSPTLERLDEVLEGVEASVNDTLVEESLIVDEENETPASENIMIVKNDGESSDLAEVSEESADDLIDVLNEGQVAWTAPEVHTEVRSIQGASSASTNNIGATAGEIVHSMDTIDDSEWDEETPVVTTVTESVELAFDAALEAIENDKPSETQLHERNETAEMALPTGDSEPTRSGEVDQ